MIAQQEIYNEELYQEIYEYIRQKINLYQVESKSKRSIKSFGINSLISNKLIKGSLIIGGLACVILHLALLLLKLF